MVVFCIVLGAILFLLMEHTLIFWCLFLPLAVVFVASSLLWLGTRGLQMHYIIISFAALFGMLLVVIFSAIPEKCEHEEVLRYTFTSPDSTAHSSVCRYCTKCDERLTEYSLFKGELVDKSYLKAIDEHSDGSEILPGEYYTVTATIPMVLTGICEVENEDFIVRFNVEFREEYRELVNSLEDDAEITFRGRFYDTGCGFTDCELLSISDSNEE